MNKSWCKRMATLMSHPNSSPKRPLINYESNMSLQILFVSLINCIKSASKFGSLLQKCLRSVFICIYMSWFLSLHFFYISWSCIAEHFGELDKVLLKVAEKPLNYHSTDQFYWKDLIKFISVEVQGNSEIGFYF